MAAEIGELLTQSELAQRLKVSKPTLWRMRKKSDFPPPIYAGGHPRWDSAQIEKWLQSRRHG